MIRIPNWRLFVALLCMCTLFPSPTYAQLPPPPAQAQNDSLFSEAVAENNLAVENYIAQKKALDAVALKYGKMKKHYGQIKANMAQADVDSYEQFIKLMAEFTLDAISDVNMAKHQSKLCNENLVQGNAQLTIPGGNVYYQKAINHATKSQKYSSSAAINRESAALSMGFMQAILNKY